MDNKYFSTVPTFNTDCAEILFTWHLNDLSNSAFVNLFGVNVPLGLRVRLCRFHFNSDLIFTSSYMQVCITGMTRYKDFFIETCFIISMKRRSCTVRNLSKYFFCLFDLCLTCMKYITRVNLHPRGTYIPPIRSADQTDLYLLECQPTSSFFYIN